ncbi:hypothetical protein IWX62_003282 [Arthrobacter sp. CAN_A1]
MSVPCKTRAMTCHLVTEAQALIQVNDLDSAKD